MLDAVPEEKKRRGASRYAAIIATFVGFLALCVSVYTAYMQRQQVRAAVWPILEFDSSNAPDIHFTLANKGVGPALIRHVIVKVDDQPVKNWREAMKKLLGPGEHLVSESDMNEHVLAPNESVTVVTSRDANNNPLVFDKSKPALGNDEQGALPRDGRDLLMFTWRMLDSAWRRVEAGHDKRDLSLPDFVEHYLPAVVSAP